MLFVFLSMGIQGTTGQRFPIFFYIFQGGIILVMVCFALSIFVLPRVLDQSIAETEALKRVYGE